MKPEVVNKNKNCTFNGPYTGRDMYITMLEDKAREFVVTHNADIKPDFYFTGRQTELEDLRQRLAEGRKSVLVSGMGGIGKTQICRKLFEEYINQHGNGEKEFFAHVGYIEYNIDMGSSLQNCLKFKQQGSPEQNQEAAWRELEYLASDGKLLLFVDNIDKPMGADLGLQRLKHIPGSIILTSRQASLGSEFEPYRIGFLSTEQCKEIYEKIRFESSGRKIMPEEKSDLMYIIENMVGKHTITVKFLAHLARSRIWTVKRLRAELEKKGFCLEFHKEGELVNIQKSYEVLYDLSMLTAAEQNILEAFSIFPYIPLSAEICNQWLLKDARTGEENDILVGLYQKGWLQFDMEQESYSLHPVFAQFINEKCRPNFKNHVELVKECQKNLAIPDTGLAKECKQYLPFAENIINKLNWGNMLNKVVFLNSTASLLEYIGEYMKVRELRERVLKIELETVGEEYSNTAHSYNNLAYVYTKLGEYEKAKELYQKAIIICGKVFEENHIDTACGYNNLAYLYAKQGEYEKAKELCQKAIIIRKKELGEEHPDTTDSYNNLAYVYAKQGEYEKAKELYQKALIIREKVLGEENPDTATSYNNLAYVYAKQGELEKAKDQYQKVLIIRKKVLGEEHPDTASSYHNLATVYAEQGEVEEAKNQYQKALIIYKKVLGEEHLDTASSYHNLALLYDTQGEYEKAKELYQKVLIIREKVLKKEHPDTASSYNNLATVYAKQGEYEKAKELYHKALRIRKKVLGEEHPHTACSYHNLAYVYADQGEYVKAIEHYEKALIIREKVLREEHPDTANSYHNLAYVYTELGEYEKAKELYQKALRIRKKVLGEEHPNTACSYHNLASVYAEQGEYEIAIGYCFKAYKIILFRFGYKHLKTQVVLENLMSIFNILYPIDEFIQWLEEKMQEKK